MEGETMNTILAFLAGLSLGVAIASAIYSRKYRYLARAFRHNIEELDAIRAALQSGDAPPLQPTTTTH